MVRRGSRAPAKISLADLVTGSSWFRTSLRIWSIWPGIFFTASHMPSMAEACIRIAIVTTMTRTSNTVSLAIVIYPGPGEASGPNATFSLPCTRPSRLQAPLRVVPSVSPPNPCLVQLAPLPTHGPSQHNLRLAHESLYSFPSSSHVPHLLCRQCTPVFSCRIEAHKVTRQLPRVMPQLGKTANSLKHYCCYRSYETSKFQPKPNKPVRVASRTYCWVNWNY